MKIHDRLVIIIGCALAACSTKQTKTAIIVPTIPVPAQEVSAQKASFAAMDSEPILAAAMKYPTALIAETPPPMSLTASDGTGLRLLAVDARAVIDGPLAFTELRLRFENPQDRVIEGRFAITLPPGAAISRLAMRLETGWQEAEVVERQLARRAYEDFLHRRQDPALMEKEAGNEFRARIFPIPARGHKDIIISYSQELASGDAVYRLPLRGLPAIDQLHVEALVGKANATGAALTYNKVALDHKSFTPDRDFEVALESKIAALRHHDLVLARIEPAFPAAAADIDSLVILFDTSASRAPGFAGEVARLGKTIAELEKAHGADVSLALATFDQVVTPIFTGKISGFGQAQLDAVLARRPLGASNLTGALAWLGKARGYERAVIITDAIATAGPVQGDELGAAVAKLRGVVERLDVVLVGGIRDDEMAARIVRGNLAADGVAIDGGLAAADIAGRLGRKTLSGITVAVEGAEWVWPNRIDGAQPGDEILVYAALAKPAAAATGPTTVVLGGPLSQTISFTPAQVTRPLLARAAANARIAKLTFERDRLAASEKELRERLRAQIIEVSTRQRVLSDFTALLVLETEADYARYKIDRRGLAGIMTVGKRGIEVFNRSQPVVIARDEPTVVTKAVDKEESKAKPKKLATMLDDDDDDFDDNVSAEKADDGRDPEKISAVEERRPEAPPPPAPMEVSADGEADMELEVSGHSVGGAAEGSVDDPAPIVARPPTATELAAKGPPAYTGKMADIMKLLAEGASEQAVVEALAWQSDQPGDVMAIIALGEALEKRGNLTLAARVYGSIIDLFPSRADLRRFAGERLERLGAAGAGLAVDAFAKAAIQRPDHLTGHRLLAYALVRAGHIAAAFTAIEAGLARSYPDGRFAGGERILREDLGIVSAVWLRREPARRDEIKKRLAAARVALATKPSLRFVLNWETDANDVDFHIYDGKGGHAFYSHKQLASGGELYADVTTGYGPECFTIPGVPQAYPYTLQIHYYSRGPMGYGMGKLEIMAHDGNGGVSFELRPFVVMNDGAYINLGVVGADGKQIAE